MNIYNTSNVCKNINYPDIYFTPEYGKACEYSDNAIWEICQYKDLMYVYFKREYIFGKNTYYDLLTPYGYSGYYFENQETFDEFIPLFREEANKRNYLTEVVRQNPYLNVNISKFYEVISSRKIFYVKLNEFNTFDNYLKYTHSDNRRGYNISVKKKLIFKIEEFNRINLDNFVTIYNSTMINLNSSKYYFFNKEYYEEFFNLKDKLFFANVSIDDKLIASCIIFKYGKLLHYHLGGSYLEYRNLRPNNLIHSSVIKYGIENNYEKYILGGGLKDNDSLYEFKKKISNNNFDYNIYKNILNEEIYNTIKNLYLEDNYFPIYRK